MKKLFFIISILFVASFGFASEIVWDTDSMTQIDYCQIDSSVKTSEGRYVLYIASGKLFSVKKNSDLKFMENEYMEEKEFFRDGSTNSQIFWDALGKVVKELGIRKGDYFQIIISTDSDLLNSWLFNGIYVNKKNVKGDFYTVKLGSALSDTFWGLIDELF